MVLLVIISLKWVVLKTTLPQTWEIQEDQVEWPVVKQTMLEGVKVLPEVKMQNTNEYMALEIDRESITVLEEKVASLEMIWVIGKDSHIVVAAARWASSLKSIKWKSKALRRFISKDLNLQLKVRRRRNQVLTKPGSVWCTTNIMMSQNGTLMIATNLTASSLATTKRCKRSSKKNSREAVMAPVARKDVLKQRRDNSSSLET